MVAQTLNELNIWYQEPTNNNDRPKLLSKLAVLELCGWIEEEFDRLIRIIDINKLNDSIWIQQKVIGKTSGFNYEKHWRQMLCLVVGEVFARRVENHMETNFPGDLDRLKTSLKQLWKQRCIFAHSDLGANVATQQSFSAPSVTLTQYTALSALITRYENSLLSVMQQI